MKYAACARTDIGKKRTNNEDCFSVNSYYMQQPAKDSCSFFELLKEGVFSVCDGMGGEEHGEYASLSGAKTFADNYVELLSSSKDERKKTADRCIRSANADICEEMIRKNARIGSTAVLACVKDGRADIFNVGDSRAYLYRSGSLNQLTKDHTVYQQKLDLKGTTGNENSDDPEKHRLTQHLGIFEDEMVIEAFHAETSIENGDILLLCSDGLTDMVTDEEIAAICGAPKDVVGISSALVNKALEHGGVDNITVIVICQK